jgi:hypothetical protein
MLSNRVFFFNPYDRPLFELSMCSLERPYGFDVAFCKAFNISVISSLENGPHGSFPAWTSSMFWLVLSPKFNFIMRPFTCTSSLQTWASLVTKFLHREFESSSFMVVRSSEAIDNHVSSNLLKVVFSSSFKKKNNNNQGFTALKIKLSLCYRIQLDHSIKLNTNS